MFNQNNDRRSTLHCPRCGRLISKQADSCINCGLPFPNLIASIPLLGSLIRGQISFVDPITITCFGLYVLALALDLTNVLSFDNIFSALSPSGQSLLKLGMGGRIPLQYGNWWTLITATYLHGSVFHILFNMLWLRQIGHLVEELFGVSRFFIIYTFAGLTGSLLSVAAGTPFFVGASGAIFGLFGALIYYGWHRGGTFGGNIFRQMIIWAGIAFIMGFFVTNVDNWGHLGGLLGGALAAYLLGYNERKRMSIYHHLAAFLLVIVVLACFGLQAWYFATRGI
jgi:rhomboid protease GluP